MTRNFGRDIHRTDPFKKNSYVYISSQRKHGIKDLRVNIVQECDNNCTHCIEDFSDLTKINSKIVYLYMLHPLYLPLSYYLLLNWQHFVHDHLNHLVRAS